MKYKAEIVRVIDGDTVEAIMHSEPFFGVRSITKQILRLARINAPEVRGVERKFGLQAERGLQDMVDAMVSSGNMVEVQANDTDSFGRYIAEIWFKLSDDDTWTNISDWMVECAFAEYREY